MNDLATKTMDRGQKVPKVTKVTKESNTIDWDEIIDDWNPEEDMLEVQINSTDDFRKIIETLTRIGIESKQEKKLTQSCHILQKQGRYYIMHFKELFLLDGKTANFTVADFARRNAIAHLLQEWGLLTILNEEQIDDLKMSMKYIKVIPYSEKKDFILDSKYTIGKKRREHQQKMN